MSTAATLQDLLDDVLFDTFLFVVSTAVAEQGVEIHQWLRDEKARRREEEPCRS
jgi:hypothetical protein